MGIYRAMSPSTPSNADQFKQSFREEAREILVDLESALLELNENRGDTELVGRVFRGLHTIKGSGAMFGFEQLAAFTHDLETAFDEVRNGRLEVRLGTDRSDACPRWIRFGPCWKRIRPAPGPPTRPLGADILESVRRLAGIQESQTPAKKDERISGCSGCRRRAARRTGASTLLPDPDLMLNGANPLLLLRELRQLGGLSVRASMAAVPPLGELDPERCYVSWEMVSGHGRRPATPSAMSSSLSRTVAS